MGKSVGIVTAVILTLATFIPINSWANDRLPEFFKGATYHMWPSIPFVRGADLQAYREQYGRTRSDLRWELIEQAAELMDAGALGAEALAIVLAMDDLVTKHRRESLDGMGVALEGFFDSQLDLLYEKHRPKNRYLDFRQLSPPVQIISDVRRGNMPGYISPNEAKKIDFIAYGTYSTHGGVNGALQVILYIVNVKTGITRVLKGSGSAEFAGNELAKKLFDLFQKTRFPSTLTYGRGKALKLLEHNAVVSYGKTALRKSYPFAKEACEDSEGRLPNRRELSAIMRAGDYNGGVTINTRKRENYYWALRGTKIYDATSRTIFPPHLMNSATHLKYICVE